MTWDSWKFKSVYERQEPGAKTLESKRETIILNSCTAPGPKFKTRIKCRETRTKLLCYTLLPPPLSPFLSTTSLPLVPAPTPSQFKLICLSLPGFWRTWRWYCSAHIPWTLAALQGRAGILFPREWYPYPNQLSVAWFVLSSPTRASEIHISLKCLKLKGLEQNANPGRYLHATHKRRIMFEQTSIILISFFFFSQQ